MSQTQNFVWVCKLIFFYVFFQKQYSNNQFFFQTFKKFKKKIQIKIFVSFFRKQTIETNLAAAGLPFNRRREDRGGTYNDGSYIL